MNVARLAQIEVGEALPERVFKPDTIQLFLYDAALWNAHRIHYDYPYATEVEGYPDLVVPGPLLGDWLNQCVVDWAGTDGVLASIEYSNRKASYVGETLRSVGRVLAIDMDEGEVSLEVAIKNEENEIVAPGLAVARFWQKLAV